MEQLLSKWAEIAPDECEYRDAGLYGDADYLVLYPTGASWYYDEYHNMNSDDESRILGATMQAIERRGWRIRISSLHNEREGFYGCIVTDSEQKTLGGSRDDRPSYAALEAYLQALAEVS